MIRYFGDYVIDSLKNRQLKVSAAEELNDPFDFALTYDDNLSDLPSELQSEEPIQLVHMYHNIHIRQYYKNPHADFSPVLNIQDRGHMLKKCLEHTVKDMIGSFTKLLCFSSSKISEDADILMWSHYGHSHSGYRLHFNSEILKTIGGMHQVNYTNKRPILPIALFDNDDAPDSLLVKSTQWKYEDESRIIIDERKTKLEPESGFTFTDLPAKALLRVDIGIKPKSMIADELINILCEEPYQHVELYQTCMDDSMFQLNYKRIYLSHQVS